MNNPCKTRDFHWIGIRWTWTSSCIHSSHKTAAVYVTARVSHNFRHYVRMKGWHYFNVQFGTYCYKQDNKFWYSKPPSLHYNVFYTRCNSHSMHSMLTCCVNYIAYLSTSNGLKSLLMWHSNLFWTGWTCSAECYCIVVVDRSSFQTVRRSLDP